MPNEEDVIPLDKLARVYRKIYSKVQELTKEYESQIEELKVKQDEIKNAMKDQMLALGSSSRCAQMKALLFCHKRHATTQTIGIHSRRLSWSMMH